MSRTAEVSWTPPEGETVDGYVIEKREIDGEWVECGRTGDTKFVVDGLPEFARAEFRVRAIVGGVIEVREDDESSDALFVPTFANIDPPDALSNVTAQQDDDYVILAWDEIGSLANLEAIEVREGASWVLGVPRAEVPPEDVEARIGWLSADATSYWLAARNFQGFYGDAVEVSFTAVRREKQSVETTTAEAPSFAGTGTNTEVVSSKLQPEAMPVLDDLAAYTLDELEDWPLIAAFRPGSSYVSTTVDLGSGVEAWRKVEVLLGTEEIGSTPTLDELDGATYEPEEDFPDPNAEPWSERVDLDGRDLRGIGLRIEVDTAPDAGSPSWDGWRPWRPIQYRGRYFRIRLVFDIAVGFFFVRFATLTWRLIARNVKHEGEATYSGGPMTVSFSSTTLHGVPNFSAAPTVEVTPQGTTAYIPHISNRTATGFDLYLTDLAGSDAPASVDFTWSAEGIS